MPKVDFQVVGDFSKVKQKGINPETTINFYAVNLNDKKTEPALVCTQGLQEVVTLGRGSRIRQLYSDQKNNALYAVCSQYVYKLDINLNAIIIGTLNTTTGVVNIAQNNANQIFFEDQKDGWIYDITANTFEQIEFPDNFSPQSADFMDTYFITAQSGTNNFNISNQSDGTTWEADNFSQLQTRADNIVACVVLKRQLFIFGERTTEIWIDQGQLDFPFVRDNTILFEFGAASLGSIIQTVDLMFWLSRNDEGTSSIMMSDGGLPRAISTIDIDQEITDYDIVSDARGYVYKIDGHLFYSLNFPNANYKDPITGQFKRGKTWTYDISTNFWFNQEMQNGDEYIVSSSAYFNGDTYGGNSKAPIIYHMHGNLLTNDGEPINRTRITHRFNMPTYEQIMVNFLELDIVQGVGTTTGQGKNPTVELQVSYDGGTTYKKQKIGKISALGNSVGYRTKFWKLGINKDFVFKIICYDPIDLTIRGAAIDVDPVGN